MAVKLTVPSMVCDGCVETVTEAIKKVDGSATVDIDLESKQVVAETAASESSIKQAVQAAGHTID
ncbi:MAG: heavy-metal-associated domain-containing protein [Leptolyngbyaceae cyanobacterium SM1_1_3]|nr:heavy-metal-associated domain-containing protein [Leptolyngbyaceae cyanobacterium SM1_1_3]NJN02951.1 heavy-metal-associated domain-containing protein [Leptolyngbyaceae cyanobacterium RM1_1_2]NJO08847.1 heavy-metal-associated domain-containing protein [Leptolyngbyaceae cyanobacterium SL_1_1]